MTQTNVRVQMQIRRDTAANWSSANPQLLQAEWGYETDSGKIKIGDGSTAWQQLDYAFLPISGGNLSDHLTIHNKKELRLSDHTAGGANDHYSAFKAGTQSADLTYTLPTALPTSSGQVLACTDAGVMSWASDSTTDSTKMPLAGGTFVGDVIFDGATAGRDITYDRSANNLIFNDNAKAIFGSTDGSTTDGLEIYHSGTHSIIKDAGTGNLQIAGSLVQITNEAITESGLVFTENGAVDLRYDSAVKLETTSLGTKITGDLWLDNPDNAGKDLQFDSSESKLKFDDGVKANFGSGDNLQLYFDGANSYINDTSTGELYIQGDSFVAIRAYGSGETMGKFIKDGAVEVFYDGSKKLETTSAGVNVTGSLTETSDIALKHDINTIQNPLDLIKQIRGISRRGKTNGMKSMGVIAQDVEKVFPELVHGSDGSKSLQYSGLIGALVESVKELTTKIEVLNTEVATLKG